MTMSADDRHEALSVLTGRDFGGPLTGIIVRYLREHTPEGTIEAVLRAAGETRSADTLSDDNGWSSYQQYRRLLEATAGVLGGSAGLAIAGSRVFESIGSVETVETLRALGSPTPAYLAIAGFNEGFMPAVAMTFETISTNECRVEMRMRDPNAPFREHCAFEFGMLTAICKIFGFAAAELLDEVCQCDGAQSCSARLRWESIDDETARSGRSELRTRISEARLDELQRTVGELVSGGGLEAVLARVVAAARRAVQAPSFVLDIRPGAAFERLVHTEGIGAADADAIARGLRDGTTAPPANLLVSGVVSERAATATWWLSDRRPPPLNHASRPCSTPTPAWPHPRSTPRRPSATPTGRPPRRKRSSPCPARWPTWPRARRWWDAWPGQCPQSSTATTLSSRSPTRAAPRRGCRRPSDSTRPPRRV